jgi:hypothetical protein
MANLKHEHTINEENRLKIKIKLLETDKINYEKLDAKIETSQRQFLKNNIRVGTEEMAEEERRPMTDQEIEQELSWERTKSKHRRQLENKLIQELENEK